MARFTTIGRGHGAPCQPATERAWMAARQDAQLAALCKQIVECGDAEQQKKLKDRLPVWTPRCGEFANDHRAEKDAVAPLNRQMFDIDEKGHTEAIIRLMIKDESIGEMYIGPFLVLMVEESVRHGTHVLVVPPEGMSLDDAQAEFSQLIGLKVDPAVKNVAGCIYMVPEDHVKYQSKRFFDVDIVNQGTAFQAGTSVGTGHPEASSSSMPPVVPQAPREHARSSQILASSQNTSDNYDGIPYALLVDSLADQLGGVPVHGSRNNFLFSMACHLRYVCNDDPNWIAQVLPTYGEDPERVRKTIQSACNRAQSRNMPNMLQRAIGVARGQYTAQLQSIDPSSSNPLSSMTPPPLPKKLPKLIQLLISKVDPMYAPAVAQSVFPALGAHLHEVTTKYIDNTEVELGAGMSVLMAKQSIGKGAVNKPIDFIMEDILARDDYNRELEANWKQQCKTSKSNEKKPKRPEGLCIQNLMSNMTNAALVQRLMDVQAAGGRYIYVRMDEIELLDQIQATGGSDVSEVIRLAFTQSPYGQERVGPDSVTGHPRLRFNFNASTTIPAGQAYFRKGLTNGTLSRICFATIIKPIGKRGIPRYGNYDDEFRKALQPYIVNLNAASGLIECAQATRMAEQIYTENEELADLSEDDEFETLSYRSCRMAYDKAMILYIAHGHEWTKEMADFCRWSHQYDMWIKMHYFGQSMREQNQVEAVQPTKGPQNMLDMLPDRFGKQDLIAVHRAQGKDGNVMQLIYNWINRKYIEQDEATQEYVKSQKYLSRHKKKLS